MMNIMRNISRKINQLLLMALMFFAVPMVVFAAPANFKEFAAFVVSVLQNVISILFASLAVGLLYGVVLYMANSENEKKRLEIKGYLLWGVIGIIVVMGIWGILALLGQSVFGTGVVGIPQISAPTQ